MRDVEGKVAFITGGASGIGFGMARTFLAAGMKVVMADISEANLADAARQLEGSNQAYHFMRLDVTDREAMAAAADEAEQLFGAVHLLCNNAGIGYAEPMTTAGYGSWDKMFAINVGGVINGIVTFVPRIRAHGEGGHIVNTASIAGILPLPDNGGIYSGSKFAVRGISESLRLALAPHGVGVSTLFPGLTRSRIMESLPEGEDDELSLGFAEAHRYAMDPLDLGRAVLDAVRDNKPFIIAHPEFREEMKELHDELMDAIRDDLPMDPRRAEFEMTRRNFITELKRNAGD
ncbi:SDR family oxidoreductase [Sphingomonas sp. MMS24-J13]|uniref:SDR family oxidoreductase n=1 Tax=Sphingomonas sp. MMS24-J13 TaxID=3238686 RepID=UPI00384D7990